MYFSVRRVREARARAHRPVARVALVATVALGLATAARLAEAAPLDDPFIGGLTFTGPTSGNLAAVYWNPAALGLVRGLQVMAVGTAQLTTIDVQRGSIDPLSAGMPPLMLSNPNATAHDFATPSLFGPRSYLAISSDLGGDRFTLAFATYMPWVEQVTYPLSPTGAGDEPTRYHALKVDLRNLALVPALAIRFGNELRVGLAPGFMFSTGQLSFAEDLALDGGSAGLDSACNGVRCGPENPAAAARFNVASGHGLGDAKFSVTLGGGIYWRRRNLEIGLAYQSRPIGGRDGVEVSGQRSTATLPPRDGGAGVACAGGQTDRCVFGDLSYKLPDVFIVGATWRLYPGLELSAMVRWLWMHVHDRIDVRLFGPELENMGLPQHVVFYRGFQDVWDTRARVSYWWREQIRIGAAVRIETSAVPHDAVNPAAVDAFKVQPLGMIEVRIFRRIWLSAGYGITFMPSVDVTNSVFKPEYARDCVDSGGNLATDACQARLAGRARPTANGRYTATRQDFGLTLTARF